MKDKTEDAILQVLYNGCLDRKELLAYFAETKMLALINGMLVLDDTMRLLATAFLIKQFHQGLNSDGVLA